MELLILAALAAGIYYVRSKTPAKPAVPAGSGGAAAESPPPAGAVTSPLVPSGSLGRFGDLLGLTKWMDPTTAITFNNIVNAEPKDLSPSQVYELFQLLKGADLNKDNGTVTALTIFLQKNYFANYTSMMTNGVSGGKLYATVPPTNKLSYTWPDVTIPASSGVKF